MTNTTAIGKRAENIAKIYLQNHGYKIIGQNVRTRFYEIDIIAEHDGYIVFTEVKYRRNNNFGGGAESITAQKQARLIKASQGWLVENSQYNHLQPRIDVIVVEGSSEHITHHYSSAIENS